MPDELSSRAPRLRVRVPCSTSNLGPGFDFLGLALSLELEVELLLRPDHSAHEFDTLEGLAADWPRERPAHCSSWLERAASIRKPEFAILSPAPNAAPTSPASTQLFRAAPSRMKRTLIPAKPACSPAPSDVSPWVRLKRAKRVTNTAIAGLISSVSAPLWGSADNAAITCWAAARPLSYA